MVRHFIWTFFVAVLGTLLMIVSAAGDSFTLDPPSPMLGIMLPPAGPADILWDVPGIGGLPGAPPPPSIGVPFPALGLVPGDVVDAISDGFDPVFIPGHLDYFSVTRGSFGAPGSGVFAEFTADTPPLGPPGTPGHAGDIFLANGGVPPGTNILAPPTFGWTLGTTTGDEANTNLITPTPPPPPAIGDNVNAYDLAMITPPTAATPVFFSLAAGSPTLAILGATPADVLVAVGGPLPAIAIPAVALGLPVGLVFDMDALALVGAPLAPGSIEYSLTAATAALIGLTGGDILGFGPGVVVVHPFATIGLLPMDDVDALDVDQRQVPEPMSASLLGLGALLLLRRRR